MRLSKHPPLGLSAAIARWAARASLAILTACGPTGAPAVGFGVAGPVGQETGPTRERIHKVPLVDREGQAHLLHTRICRPPGEAPARVAVIAHGSPAIAADRPTYRPSSCEGEAARWFLARGYLVVFGLRRGFGETGGPFAEAVGESCVAERYVASARESARDLDALVVYATGLPYAKPNGAIVVGQSAGGWAALGYNSMPHPKVAAMVSMAGGRGGRVNNQPNRNCRADQLAQAAGKLGETATTPMVWVYTENDSFFAPQIASDLHFRFTQAGGQAVLHRLGPFGADGHGLFNGRGGPAIWGPILEPYLRSRGAL